MNAYAIFILNVSFFWNSIVTLSLRILNLPVGEFMGGESTSMY